MIVLIDTYVNVLNKIGIFIIMIAVRYKNKKTDSMQTDSHVLQYIRFQKSIYNKYVDRIRDSGRHT